MSNLFESVTQKLGLSKETVTDKAEEVLDGYRDKIPDGIEAKIDEVLHGDFVDGLLDKVGLGGDQASEETEATAEEESTEEEATEEEVVEEESTEEEAEEETEEESTEEESSEESEEEESTEESEETEETEESEEGSEEETEEETQ